MFYKDDPKITCFLVKVASRCNLNCDYCYVFNHADQSWKDKPPTISDKHIQLLACRLYDYVQERRLTNILVVFHGGEPLLIGSEKLCEIATIIRAKIGSLAEVDFSLQTNGVIFRERDAELFLKHNIGVSLSLDGPKKANDLHRITHNMTSSYDKVIRAYHILKKYPQIFTGVIAVIDTRISPLELFEFFNELDPPCLDFLLPDANYVFPPAFRDKKPGVYQQWLCEAFDLWVDKYPHISVRFFDNLLAALSGSKSGTDAFGFGDVSLLSIETDGTYHDLDVLKITKENFSYLGMGLETHSILEASKSNQISVHRKLISQNGICATCQKCPVVDICASGSVPHRFDGQGFNNPTIYCGEMYTLINHARTRLSQILAKNIEPEISIAPPLRNLDTKKYNNSNPNSKEFQNVYNKWIEDSLYAFERAIAHAKMVFPNNEHVFEWIKNLSEIKLRKLVTLPQVKLWTYVANLHQKDLKVFNLEDKPIFFDLSIFKYSSAIISSLNLKNKIAIHEPNHWLRLPFGNQVLFESGDVTKEQKIVSKALSIIQKYKPGLYEEMLLISPCIQFIQDPTAHPEKLVSFSDHIVPGALYICVKLQKGYADPYDIADSIIHEHRHQKLYLLQNYSPIIVSDLPYVSSPWREEPRPVSGLFHAVFVFVELQSYWALLTNEPGSLGQKAIKTVKNYAEMLSGGIKTLKSTNLTSLGFNLLEDLEYISKLNTKSLKEINEASSS